MEIQFNRPPAPTVAEVNTTPIVKTGAEGQPTSAELQKRTFEAMGWEEPVIPETMRAEPEAAPVPAVAAAPVVEPALAAPVVQLTNRELIAETALQVGNVIARAMTPAVRPGAPAPEAPTAIEMIEDDAEDLKAVQYLEKTDRKYAGLTSKFTAWIALIYAYQDQWAAANAGKEFEANDAEHDAWFEANPCPVDKKTLEKAKRSMEAEEIYERRAGPEMEAIKEERKRQKAEQVWQDNAAEVYLAANVKILEMVRAVDPEMAKLLTNSAGVPDLSAANAKKADDYDPIAYEVLDVSAQRLWKMVVELEKTVLPGIEIKLLRTNGVHAAIIAAQEEEEKRIQLTPAEIMKDGKRFVPVAEWITMTAEQQASHWTLTVDDMEALLVKNFAAQAKKSINHMDSTAKKKYGNPNPPVQERPTVQPPAPPVVPQAQPQSRKVNSPSISSPSDVVPSGGNTPPARKSYGEVAAAEHFK